MMYFGASIYHGARFRIQHQNAKSQQILKLTPKIDL